jgi:hypothetical protein
LSEKVYAPKRQRTVDLVRASIATLSAAGRPVSLASISAQSKQVDPAGQGVSESAILGNLEACALYKQQRTWKQRSPLRQRAPEKDRRSRSPHQAAIKPGRDIARVRRRYLRKSKGELVERLLVLEEEYTALKERWLRLNDDLLLQRLEAEADAASHRRFERRLSTESGATL